MKNLTLSAVSISLSLAVLAAVSGCSSSPTQSSAFSGKSSKSGYQLPPYEEKVLPNGLRVLFVPDKALPYVSYSLLVRVGGVQDPAGLAGLSSMVAELLDKGTHKRTAPQIAAEIGQMGADFDASAASEYSIVNASALSTQADPLLKNLLDIVTSPTFSDVEVERLRKQMLASIQRRVDNPDAFSDLAFDAFMYGEHPYARAISGDLKSVKAIKKKNIIQHYLRYYRPNNSILAVIGQYTPELAVKIEKEFGAWQSRQVAAPTYPQPPAIQGRQTLLVDKPGLVQAQIHMGHIGIKRQNQDFIALRVANTILGGAFASRLNDRIRKDLGLTYSIGSSFDARLDAGPFEISTFTKNESVAQTVSESLKVLADFRAKGVTNAEVNMAKGYLKGIFPTAIETPEKLALNLMLLRFYSIPDSYLTNYLRDVDNLSASDINAVIRTYFHDDNLKILVYTNAAKAKAQLQTLADQKVIGNLEVKKAADYQ